MTRLSVVAVCAAVLLVGFRVATDDPVHSSVPSRVVVSPGGKPAAGLSAPNLSPPVTVPVTSTTLDRNFSTLNMALVLDREAEAQTRARVSSAPKVFGGMSHLNHAPHSNSWWIGVSICEQGGRNDPYFGYFSYMDGSEGGGKSWAEQVKRGNETIAQYGDHAWAPRCVAAGYRAAPGG